MDRRYVIGFLLGAVLVLAIFWINSAWEGYQKQEQSKITTEQQVMALINERDMRRVEINQMRADISALRSQVSGQENMMSKFVFLRQDLDALTKMVHDFMGGR